MSAPRNDVVDRRGRSLSDLRISVTDRCNFRCRYCMPRDQFGPDHGFLPRAELLSYEEIVQLATLFVELGVRKIRLTGGEPLLRRDLSRLIEMLAAIEGVEDIALTTNASLLAPVADRLAAAGLRRVTVSLDSLDEETFRAMADTPVPLARVLDGIDAAVAAGLAPLKLNTVVRRGVNDHEVVDLADFARRHGCVVRFIEYMDVGTTNGWRADEVVAAPEILERIAARFPLEPVDPAHPSEVAERYRYLDGGGEVGVIASITKPFCGDCTRIRLSAVGELYTCLFATRGHDVRALLRGGATDDELRSFVRGVWARRDDRYSEERHETPVSLPKIEMSYIGG